MLRDGSDSARMHVTRQANFQGNAFIENVLRKRTHADDASFLHRHVFDQPDRMADAMRSAPLDRLPDGFLSERFAGVNRDVEILALDIVESIDVLLRRKATLLTRQVKADHAVRPKVDSQFGDLLR